MPRGLPRLVLLCSALLSCSVVLAPKLCAQSDQASTPDTVDKDYSAELPRLPPMSPSEALAAFDVVEGFEIRLVAAEPLVTDPVAFAFDARGRLFVVEMRDYSEQDSERLGRIALLSDIDGDGVMDQRSTFAEGLSWPTAIWPWRDGVLVAEAPRITWYRDLDQDGRSDRHEDWFVGFGRGNVQGLVNSLRWGVDGAIHGATSSSGAELEIMADSSSLSLARRDFAIDPLTKTLRPESGGGQHGMSFNRWGDKFVTSNSDHLQQIIDLDGWLAEHKSAVPIPSTRRSIAEDGPQAEVFRASPVEPWRVVRTRLRISGVAPGIVEGGGRAAGYFTGATGTWIVDQEMGFGDGAETALVCDVGSNLIHRKRLLDQGLFWSGQRIDDHREWVRSSDTWFRPVQLGDGPDGAVYIADMVREVIEHPQSLPPMIKKHLDLTSGRDRGRIWKVTKSLSEKGSDPLRRGQKTNEIDSPPKGQTPFPIGSKSTPTQPLPTSPNPTLINLDALTSQQLVDRLGHPIAWQRRMASQLLVERGHDAGVRQALTKALRTAVEPEARLLSIHIANRLAWFDVALAEIALQDPHERVLEHAIQLIGAQHLARRPEQSLAEALRKAATSSSPRIQLAIAKAAADMDQSLRLELLTRLLPRVDHALVRAVVSVAAGKDSWKLLRDSQLTASQLPADSEKYAMWLQALMPLWVAQLPTQPEFKSWLPSQLSPHNAQVGLWLDALCQLPNDQQAQALLQALSPAEQRRLQDYIEMQLTSDPPGNQEWIGLLSTVAQDHWLEELLVPTASESEQTALIRSLSWANHPRLAQELLARFTSLTPALQQHALRVLSSRSASQLLLLAALEDKRILPAHIPADLKQRLLAERDPQLAKRFQSVLSRAAEDRAHVIASYASAMQTAGQGSADRGRQVFTRVCAACHRIGQIGSDVGPPLKSLADKTPQQLLETILDPNREVDPKYSSYTVLLQDGQVIAGIIRDESSTQIDFAEVGGKLHRIPREEIEQLKSNGVSFMPVGLEEQVSPAEMLDLIAFLLAP